MRLGTCAEATVLATPGPASRRGPPAIPGDATLWGPPPGPHCRRPLAPLWHGRGPPPAEAVDVLSRMVRPATVTALAVASPGEGAERPAGPRPGAEIGPGPGCRDLAGT